MQKNAKRIIIITITPVMWKIIIKYHLFLTPYSKDHTTVSSSECKPWTSPPTISEILNFAIPQKHLSMPGNTQIRKIPQYG